MFFFLSKTLDFLLTPLAWSLGLVLLGLVQRSAGRRVFLTLAGILVLVTFSMEAVANRLELAVERPAERTVKLDVTYDVVILLGGVSESRVGATWGQASYNDNTERLLETYELLRDDKAKNAILSVGDIGGIPERWIESHSLRDKLVLWGIAPERLVVEDHSLNTRDNAVMSAAIVRERGWQSVLVVTSAFHMPRAVGCFRAVDLPVDTIPVDYRSYATSWPTDRLPRARFLDESSNALREWFGRGIYRARGFSR